MITIREHTKAQLPATVNESELEAYLNSVWNSRQLFYSIEDGTERSSTQQGFFTFGRNQEIKASQYVGFLQYRSLYLSVYPKLFPNLQEEETPLFYKHLVYWLSYCRRINFPFSHILAEIDQTTDFPEALIYFFSKTAHTLLQTAPFHQFETVEDTLAVVKGRLLTHRYIQESLAKGNYHKLICEHEPFQYDNQLNQIIKYVARKLLQRCRFKETWHLLEQVIFHLDEVSDVTKATSDCDKVRLNPLFADYKPCLDMCRFFLANEQIHNVGGLTDQFCFLLPMNYIYEDYLCGFIEDRFKGRFKALYQYTGWLTDQKVFQIRNDLVLQDKDNKLLLIVDAKYKLRQRDQDAKRGIDQSDLYQMLAYAVRHNCNKVLLLYPKLHTDKTKYEPDTFTISSPLLQEQVSVTAADIQLTADNIDVLDDIVHAQLNNIIYKVLTS